MNDNKDTLLLLRECSAGIRMAVASIDDVLPYLEESELTQVLKESKTEHKDLEKDIDDTLHKLNCEGKEPNLMAKGMSKIKANAEAEANETISKSLTNQVIENKKIEKWNGELPRVQGGSGTIVDIGSVDNSSKGE